MTDTNLRIKKEVKEKLDLLKNENNETYSNIINQLLEQSGGVLVDDVITIQREQIAFTLRYQDLNNPQNDILKDVTYADLHHAEIGTIYKANPNPESKNYITSNAETIRIKHTDSADFVVLEMENIKKTEKGEDVLYNISHIALF